MRSRSSRPLLRGGAGRFCSQPALACEAHVRVGTAISEDRRQAALLVYRKIRGASWCTVNPTVSIDPIAPSQPLMASIWYFITVDKASVAKSPIARLWFHGVKPPAHERETHIDDEARYASHRDDGRPTSRLAQCPFYRAQPSLLSDRDLQHRRISPNTQHLRIVPSARISS
jgi:hypothetical protein